MSWAGQTGKTKLTFRLDFPGNLCRAALVIRAMFIFCIDCPRMKICPQIGEVRIKYFAANTFMLVELFLQNKERSEKM